MGSRYQTTRVDTILNTQRLLQIIEHCFKVRHVGTKHYNAGSHHMSLSNSTACIPGVDAVEAGVTGVSGASMCEIFVTSTYSTFSSELTV